MEREPGAVIAGRYRLVDKLGSGGMGAVWLCHDLSLDSTCAVKIIDSEKSRSEEVKKRFIREARATAQLRGPHVVDVFDRGEYEGILYIAMEYLEGEDLCTRLGHVGKLDSQATYRIIAHVARALSSAHALGIVHRDLKPENIYLVPGYDEEIAKVLDFGIAQHEAYRIEDHATRDGAFLGTPYYVSPEQARGKPTDHRSDLWSLAVITYQCLTGQTPFDSDSMGELMGLILYEPIPKITSANPDLTPAVEAFWKRATERDRELRFQSAREFANELGQALGLKTVVTVPTLPPRRQSSFPDAGDNRLSSLSLRSLHTPQQLRGLTPIAELTLTGDATRETLADPLASTEQGVMSTRPSVSSLKQGIEWGYGRLKTFPKRPLVFTAVGLGILLGGLGMLVISTKLRPSLLPAGDVSSESQVGTNPTAEASSAALRSKVAPATASPDVVPVIASAPVKTESKAPETTAKKQGSSGRRPPAGTPDYGI